MMMLCGQKKPFLAQLQPSIYSPVRFMYVTCMSVLTVHMYAVVTDDCKVP